MQSGLINITQIAKLMYPNNKLPGQYLHKKLHNKEGQSFNSNDRNKVKTILNDFIK